MIIMMRKWIFLIGENNNNTLTKKDKHPSFPFLKISLKHTGIAVFEKFSLTPLLIWDWLLNEIILGTQRVFGASYFLAPLTYELPGDAELCGNVVGMKDTRENKVAVVHWDCITHRCILWLTERSPRFADLEEQSQPKVKTLTLFLLSPFEFRIFYDSL